MSDITIGEHDYILGQMPARKQFHVSRRLAPLLSALVGQEGGINLASMKIQPIAEALSSMSDADCDYVLDACLGVVSVVQDGRPMPVMRNGQMMFAFIDMPTMIRLTSEVVMRDLSGFMAAVPSASTPLAAA